MATLPTAALLLLLVGLASAVSER